MKRSEAVFVFVMTLLAFGLSASGQQTTVTSLPPASSVAATSQPGTVPGLRFETIASGIHLIWTPRHEAKVVVAEFSTFVALIEAPFDDRTVRDILAELRARFPKKPLRYALHSHHHDHSINAVDPLLVAGAQIVTSGYNLDQLLTATADEALLRSRVVLVDDRFEIADQTNRLRVWLLKQGRGEKQWLVPTAEYMVFDFPDQQVLVSGCMYNKPLTYHEVVNQRKPSLLKFIESHGLKVRTIVPTNTSSAGGFEDVCTMQMLQDTLEQGIKPEEVSKRFGAMTAIEMRDRLDAIVEEFKTKTPRSFDLMVCSSQLLRDGFPDHSIVLLDVAIKLFPSDPWPAFESGMRLWELGRTPEAEERWKTALALAKDSNEREDMEQTIGEKRAMVK
jgi:hypothetical protein